MGETTGAQIPLFDAPPGEPRRRRARQPRARTASAQGEQTDLVALAEELEAEREAAEQAWRIARLTRPQPDRRAMLNIEVARLARQLDEDEREPSPAERLRLEKMTPWHELSHVFDEDDEVHAWVRDELREVLGADEYDRCAALAVGETSS